MTSATAGLALRLDAVPEALLPYVPALPTLLREVGMIVDGQPVGYNEVEQRLRREVQSLEVYFSDDPRTERVELVLRGSGGTVEESQAALRWMGTALFSPDLRPENLPRLKDAVTQALANARNRMRGSEETWVQEPSTAFWRQTNPLFLSARCFLTASHALHRLRWGLLEASAAVHGEFAQTLDVLIEESGGASERARFEATLELVLAELRTASSSSGWLSDSGSGSDSEEAPEPEVPRAETTFQLSDALRSRLSKLSPEAGTLLLEAVRDLQKSMPEIPDESLSADVSYLCAQMTQDLARPAAETLRAIEETLGYVRKQDRSRAFFIGSSADAERLLPELEKLVAELDAHPSETAASRREPHVTRRYQERSGEDETPVFVGLVNEGTRSGVHVHTASSPGYDDTDPENLLRSLSARLYGGGGAHSMFMKTWSAGLAYSNGLGSSEADGRIRYYAERCPDLAQTMQFVVKELEQAPSDPAIAEYAVAQAFGNGRAASRYEDRGEAMAEDLADGRTPERVRAFRQGILDLRQRPDLYDQLERRMRVVYGMVLPGLDPDGATSAKEWGALYFVIGPSKQIDSWDAYLGKVEPGAKTARLYPRDFWIVAPRVSTRRF